MAKRLARKRVVVKSAILLVFLIILSLTPLFYQSWQNYVASRSCDSLLEFDGELTFSQLQYLEKCYHDGFYSDHDKQSLVDWMSRFVTQDGVNDQDLGFAYNWLDKFESSSAEDKVNVSIPLKTWKRVIHVECSNHSEGKFYLSWQYLGHWSNGVLTLMISGEHEALQANLDLTGGGTIVEAQGHRVALVFDIRKHTKAHYSLTIAFEWDGAMWREKARFITDTLLSS